MNLDDLKKYLRISHNVDDDYLTDLLEMSKKYIEEQTGKKYDEKNVVYEQAVRFMVAHFYTNRATVSEKAINVVPYTLESLIKHIGMMNYD